MAKRIQIEVSQETLDKMDSEKLPYKVTNRDIGIEDLLTSHIDVSELNSYELSRIVSAAKEAIEQGDNYGIAIDTKSGRDMNDRRAYSLESVSIVEHNDNECRHTVKELKEC